MFLRPGRLKFTGLLSGLIGLLLIATPGVRSAPLAALSIYDDALNNGWQDWSWGARSVNFNAAAPVHSGSQSIAVTYTGGWSGLQLGHSPAVDLSGYDTLRLWVYGGTTGGQTVPARFEGDGPTLTLPANTWTQIDVPFSQPGDPTQTGGMVWFNATDHAQPTFYLDDIQLINSGLPIPTPVPPGAGPALTVNAQADVHPINPDIYGLNYAGEALAAELNLPVRRWGGNSTSRYNWQIDAYNVGSDWYFENIANANSNVAALPNGSASDQFVEQDRRTGTRTIMTVPLIGWVTKRRVENHPFDCGFKVSTYGAQQATDAQWDADCGNGVRTNNSNLTGNDPTDTSVAITTTFVQGWVNHLIGQYGTAANGGVKFYNLDNEPMLWNSTQRDVHPQPVTYDELRDRTYAYAAAIKAADTSAQTLGPVLWGWCAYFYSAADGCGAGSDYAAHGNTPFVPWYLQQMQSYEQQHGTRILDYLDLHYYPQANGVSLSPAGNAATQALRLRSTRSLWDATYIDESWVSDTAPGGVAVRLIPRMRDWVNANYPGTKLAMTEYNWGALDHLNGALAQADVLGIFGREGLDLATLWGPPASHEPGAFAFRMYRNYDDVPVGAPVGVHHTFGDIGVQSTSANQDQVAIYAAKRGVDNALTLMIINKSATQAYTSTVSLSGFDPFPVAQVYRYSAANLNAIVRQADQAVGPGGFTAAFPASSITLIVIPPGVPLTPRLYLPILLKLS